MSRKKSNDTIWIVVLIGIIIIAFFYFLDKIQDYKVEHPLGFILWAIFFVLIIIGIVIFYIWKWWRSKNPN